MAVFGQLIEPLHLGHSDGGVDLAESIVVAKPLVSQPGHAFAPLVTQGAAGFGEGLIVGDDHPAFACGDLFVRIKSKNRSSPEGTNRPFSSHSPKAFASVFD